MQEYLQWGNKAKGLKASKKYCNKAKMQNEVTLAHKANQAGKEQNTK